MKSAGADRHDKNILKFIIFPLAVAVTAAVLSYLGISSYVIKQAEEHVHNVLLSHRGLHHYIQRVMHPNFYQAQNDELIRADFYSPEILSSSFIVRSMHTYYNAERRKAGLPEIYYKMAATNPRNPVNKADALEAKLLQMFNADRSLKEYRSIETHDGKKTLVYAMPFLTTEKRCLACHGERHKAPLGLQAQYAGIGGFGDQVGNIRAIEIIKAPIDQELETVAVVTTAVVAGLFTLAMFFIFTGRLRSLVQARTTDLEKEIAERKLVEQEVKTLNLELERRVEERTMLLKEANKELDTFSYSVSHDLKAPLRAIAGFATILAEDCAADLDDQGKGYVHRVQQACNRMGNQVDGLLNMSRLSRSEIQLQQVNLSELAHDIIDELQAGTAGRTIEFVVAPNMWAHGDPTLLRAVLQNLLANAIKFTQRATQARIEFSAAEKKTGTIFSIKDNGAGFDMAYADKLFGAFQRLHSEEDFAGTGIGLATVQRIISRHGGRVWAEAEPGKGATFFFVLGNNHAE